MNDFKVTIGPTTFVVSEVDGLMSKGEPVWGDADIGAATIKVESTLADGPKRATLLHEVVHICFHNLGQRELAQDEAVVDGLAHSLLQALREAPGIIW